MSSFVARISRGRSVRELVVAVAVVAPFMTHVWFSLLGGTGLGLELESPESLPGAGGAGDGCT